MTFFFCLILNSCFIFKNLPILDFKNYEKNIVNERSRFLSLDQIYPDAKLINEKLNSYLLMSKNKNKYFYLSNYTYKYLQKTKINHKNITTNIDAASHIIYVMGENDYILMANKLNSIDIVYGVHDYDVDFYPMQGGMTIKILSGAKENFATSN